MLSNVTPVILFSALLLVAPVHAVVIDDFSVGDVRLLSPSETVSQTLLDPSSVVGGARRIAVHQNAMDLSISAAGLVAKRTGDWGYFTLMYGFDAPLNADFTENGHDRLRLKFNSDGSENAAGILWISINSALPPTSNAPGPGLGTIRGGAIIEIPYSEYATNMAQVSTFAIQSVRMSGGFSLDSVTTAGPPLIGDFDRDGVVGSGDLDEFRRTFGRTTIPQEGYLSTDANLDRRVDGADLLIWQQAFGSSTANTATVPEPAAIIPCCAVMTACVVRSRPPSRRLRGPQG